MTGNAVADTVMAYAPQANSVLGGKTADPDPITITTRAFFIVDFKYRCRLFSRQVVTCKYCGRSETISPQKNNKFDNISRSHF